MSTFLRPEARRVLMRWRDVLVSVGVLALGLYFLTVPGPVVQGVGAVMCLAGLGYIIVGWRRMRFRGAGDAPGAIRVDEGQITYLGPVTGGAVALSLMTELSLTGPPGARVWHIRSEVGPPLDIPHDAVGSDALFDAFATLPGLQSETLVRLLRSAQTGRVTVWRRADQPGLTPLGEAHSPYPDRRPQ